MGRYVESGRELKFCIHRGSHQIGGMAAEFATENARIIIDMGDELSLDDDFIPVPLHIAGVTDANGRCDAVLFTHYHGDHVGQLEHVHPDIPLYTGAVAKEIMCMSAEHNQPENHALRNRLAGIRTFADGEKLKFGDIVVTPLMADHSACDSYMFLIEAAGRRVLYTGDFRLHGIHKGMMERLIAGAGKIDVFVTEGTTISRAVGNFTSEEELAKRIPGYLQRYKYVFVLCATTNVDRINAFANAVPEGKYCVSDKYQQSLVEVVSRHQGKKMPKLLYYGDNILPDIQKLGGLIFVRANPRFERIIKKFDRSRSILLYSMWDGYINKPGSRLPEFLSLTGTWEKLHTSGHASAEDIRHVAEKLSPEVIIPMHTDAPQRMKQLFPAGNVAVLQDEEWFSCM